MEQEFKVKLESGEEVNEINVNINPIYDDLKLSIGEYIYKINSKGEIVEKLHPTNEKWDYIVKASKLQKYILESVPENYGELIDELANEIEDINMREDVLRHMNSLMLNPILNYNLAEDQKDYIVSVRQYISDITNEIYESRKIKVGTPKPTPPETKALKEGERPKIKPEYMRDNNNKKWWKIW